MNKGRGKDGRLRDWDGTERANWIAGLVNGEWANLAQYSEAQGLRYQTVRRMAAKYGWHTEATRVRQMAEQQAIAKLEDQEAKKIAKAKRNHLETAVLMRNVMLDALMPWVEDDEGNKVRKLRDGLTAGEGIRAGRAAIKIERDAYGLNAKDAAEAGLGGDDSLVKEIQSMGPDERRRRIAHLQGIVDATPTKPKS